MTINEISDKIYASSDNTRWNNGVCNYAVELLEGYISDNGLSIWDDADRLKAMTEDRLLNGAKDWDDFSRSGNSHIYHDDISMRLLGRKATAGQTRDWFGIQGKALEQAAEMLLNIVNNQAAPS